MSDLYPPFEYGSLRYRPNTIVEHASNLVVYGRVHLPVRTGSEMAFVKLLSERAFAVESVCAWLARELELPAPEPLWIAVHRNRIPGKWPFGEEDSQLCFGTIELPNARPLLVDEIEADFLFGQLRLDDILSAKIATFDVLIGNDDRHAGNMLLAPPRGVFLIDHGRALGGIGTDLFSTWQPPGPNFLLRRIQAMSAQRRFALKRPLRDFCTDCAIAVDKLPFDILVASDSLRLTIRQYLRAKAERLYDEIASSLGIPDLTGINLNGSRPIAP